MAYNLDPFVQYLQSKEIPGATPPPTAEWLDQRQERLERMGLQDGALGRMNDLASTMAAKRAAAKSGIRDFARSSGKWAASM